MRRSCHGNLLFARRVVDGAEAFAEIELLFGKLRRDIMPEVFVGDKVDVLLFQTGDHLDGIGARDDDVGERFEARRGIDVGDDGEIFDTPAHMYDLLLRRHVRHGAVRRRDGLVDLLFGTEDLGALPHERDAAKDDDGLVACDRLLCQGEAVAHKVCRRLHGVGCIVVRKDERVLASDGMTHKPLPKAAPHP